MDQHTVVPYLSRMRVQLKSLAIVGLAVCWAAVAGVSQSGSFDHSRTTAEQAARHQSLQLPKRLDVARTDAPATIRNYRSSYVALVRHTLEGSKYGLSAASGNTHRHRTHAPSQLRSASRPVTGPRFAQANRPRAPPSPLA